MEIQLIYGPNNSGKSKYAEDVAVASGKKLIYLATMVPENEENQLRIEKHRLQRQDKGFETIEMAWELEKIAADWETVVLLEDASNLVANGIFMFGADAQKALENILALAERCTKLIVVSIAGLSAEGYDADTSYYIEQLNWLNGRLEDIADSVVEMCVDPEGNCKRIVKKAKKKHYSFYTNKECEFFPCHKDADPKNHNCLFCYCPLYVLGEKCGGNFRYTPEGRKDCSNCTFPHRKENYDLIINRYPEMEKVMCRKS